jgi:hypothetical protein
VAGTPRYPQDWAAKFAALERQVKALHALAAGRTKRNTMAAGLEAATVATQDGTASTTYTDLISTPGPSVPVTIGEAGRCIVLVGCQIVPNATHGGSMAFAISGATSRAADIAQAYIVDMPAATGLAGSRAVVVEGLNPGAHTFTAKYASGGGTVLFRDRSLTVIPF